jgi:hypothetical protein
MQEHTQNMQRIVNKSKKIAIARSSSAIAAGLMLAKLPFAALAALPLRAVDCLAPSIACAVAEATSAASCMADEDADDDCTAVDTGAGNGSAGVGASTGGHTGAWATEDA